MCRRRPVAPRGRRTRTRSHPCRSGSKWSCPSSSGRRNHFCKNICAYHKCVRGCVKNICAYTCINGKNICAYTCVCENTTKRENFILARFRILLLSAHIISACADVFIVRYVYMYCACAMPYISSYVYTSIIRT